ncbi:hypothetical protein Dsin_028947 [Dipteronia sinensis]|uniref:Uncharacterized protein n=1 Tax=Dipteronia sinensis TaxID=43782 RepID=A0AAE0DV14_9ROSI|nr:hypothetical protein Dsin_028947 [Dipteronia sinensis]
MDALPMACYENLKRYLRRRRYKKLSASTHHSYKRKIRVSRLGSPGSNCGRQWRIKRMPRIQLKIVSPIKVLTKFHEAYVNMMIYFANKMANSSHNNIEGVFRGKKVARGRQIALVSSGEEVDSKLVMEIYKRISASQQSNTSTDYL